MSHDAPGAGAEKAFLAISPMVPKLKSTASKHPVTTNEVSFVAARLSFGKVIFKKNKRTKAGVMRVEIMKIALQEKFIPVMNDYFSKLESASESMKKSVIRF